jgi:hypothetical protein
MPLDDIFDEKKQQSNTNRQHCADEQAKGRKEIEPVLFGFEMIDELVKHAGSLSFFLGKSRPPYAPCCIKKITPA